MNTLRRNPDVIALAILGLVLLAPAVAAPHAPRGFHLTPASWAELALAGDPARLNGFDDIAGWTSSLERRGERVWQRLSDRMRLFEQRFEQLNTAQPSLRKVHCEADSD